MPRLKLLLVVVPTLLAGCALRQSKGIYRLSEINSQYFLLSPDAATSQGDHQTLRIPRPGTGENPKGSPAIGLFDQRTLVLFLSSSEKRTSVDSRNAERSGMGEELRRHRHEGPVAEL
jgi:hypothetical protein